MGSACCLVRAVLGTKALKAFPTVRSWSRVKDDFLIYGGIRGATIGLLRSYLIMVVVRSTTRAVRKKSVGVMGMKIRKLRYIPSVLLEAPRRSLTLREPRVKDTPKEQDKSVESSFPKTNSMANLQLVLTIKPGDILGKRSPQVQVGRNKHRLFRSLISRRRRASPHRIDRDTL
jgi:hypothetical protein